MVSAALILKVILAMHPCAREPLDVPRLTVIAQAISSVATDRYEAAALVTIAHYEANFCESVQSGRVVGYPNGHGLWQLEPGSHRVPPFEGLSYEATAHAAGEALWLWRHGQCGGDVRKRFGHYAGLGCKTWPGATPRANTFWWLAEKVLRP